jgi:hypothetical protein
LSNSSVNILHFLFNFRIYRLNDFWIEYRNSEAAAKQTE